MPKNCCILHLKEGQVETLEQLAEFLAKPGFISYLITVIVVSIVFICYLEPRYGQTNIFIYITICSLIGSLSVMAVKGVGIAFVRTFSGVANEFTNGKS